MIENLLDSVYELPFKLMNIGSEIPINLQHFFERKLHAVDHENEHHRNESNKKRT